MIEHIASTDFGSQAGYLHVPVVPQDAEQVAGLICTLEEATKKGKKSFDVKKTNFAVKNSQDKLQVSSWRFHDWDYKKKDLPTGARGLFTCRERDGVTRIVIRGYDKFFNIGEVSETKWNNIKKSTKGPYELTLKENGCIIFISGLEDDTLLVCSKHSTGDRSDVELSHASAGEQRLEKQLERIGKTKADLARELRKRNVTAVMELCDDTFEEHILAYGPNNAGLYLHGININTPELTTYPGPLVQQFADEWGFVKTGLIIMNDIDQVQAFLEKVAETGAHNGRDVEGFVIRCKRLRGPGKESYQDWFFKYKFEEPYLLYRQWRECTKSLISGKPPRFKKHVKITEEYLTFARKRLASDGQLGKLYMQNHGIIQLRNEFLEFKNLKGSEAASFEELYGGQESDVVARDIILVPIATIGCGKTTLALALSHLFKWGHIQNDNITGSKRPPRFTKAVLEQLENHGAVVADRNNAQRHERKQLLTDVKQQHAGVRLVALHFLHDDLDGVRRLTQRRVFDRGDNHQTIQAASDMAKVRGIMEGFLSRFEPCDPEKEPDVGFDAVIDLDPAVGSRANLKTVVHELHRLYPALIKTVPSAEELDAAIEFALAHKPDLRHMTGDRAPRNKRGQEKGQKPQQHAAGTQGQKKKALEYISIDVPTSQVLQVLEDTFKKQDASKARFFHQLQHLRRVQPRFHVTLAHRTASKDHPELWNRYVELHAAEGDKTPEGRLGLVDVMLEHIVFDQRLMAVAVRLIPRFENGSKTQPDWHCANRVPHITVGTRDDSIKPKESNELLARWVDAGAGPQTGIDLVQLDPKPVLAGVIRGVVSR